MKLLGCRSVLSTSETMVLSLKRVECLLQVVEEVLPQVEEYQYLEVLFNNEGNIGPRD